MQTSVLVVDDERRYRELLEMNLVRRGYRVRQAVDGLSALNAVEAEEPSLVILDLKLPDIDGYEVCRRVRAYSNVPIIMLTARAEQVEKIRGLDVGADDYVTKPFAAEELLARVDAVLRRSRAARPTAATFHSGDLHIAFAEHRVTLRGRDVELTPGEYRLLAELAENAGRVMLQDDLLSRVWGPAYPGATELLQTAIRRLRVKIEDDPHAPRYILTRRGIGYELAKD
ncbi:MAG TPA: response regulator transcription factor [Candidatus Limnocylindria bacterium]